MIALLAYFSLPLIVISAVGARLHARVGGRWTPWLVRGVQVAVFLSVYGWRVSLPQWHQGSGACPDTSRQGTIEDAFLVIAVVSACVAAFIGSGRDDSGSRAWASGAIAFALFVVTAGYLAVTAFCDPT